MKTEMKQKERTVFYVQQKQDGDWVDLYCRDSQAEAKKWIAKNNIEDAQILEVKSSTRHPEMVNRRFDNPSADVESVSEPKIKYEYRIQIQYGYAGWECPRTEWDIPYTSQSECEEDAKWYSENHGLPTRVKKVGIYSNEVGTYKNLHTCNCKNV